MSRQAETEDEGGRWHYYTLLDGRLCDERCRPLYPTELGTEYIPNFASTTEAEEWLQANNLLGSVYTRARRRASGGKPGS